MSVMHALRLLEAAVEQRTQCLKECWLVAIKVSWDLMIAKVPCKKLENSKYPLKVPLLGLQSSGSLERVVGRWYHHQGQFWFPRGIFDGRVHGSARLGH
jgi:hypothetical protein